MSSQQHRYLVALPRGERKVLLSWRLLPGDPPNTPFDVERREPGRDWKRVTPAPILDSTTFLDATPTPGRCEYRVVAPGGCVSEVAEVDSGAPASLTAREIPLPPGDAVTGTVVGDLQNNARLGYVTRVARDGRVWLCAYAHEGGPLWEADTGLPAHGGWDGSSHHVPFLCWDVNNDGRTEVLFHRCRGGYTTDIYDRGGADEGLLAVDGETGEPVWEAPWPAEKPRVMMTVGQLRGLDQPAAVVVLDETYGDVGLTAVDGKAGEALWRLRQARPAGHNLDVGDIDGDGAQEVICGGVCYNGDGSIRWEAEPFGHTDISKPCKIVPESEGLQIWYAVESGNPGVYLVDKDGRTLFREAFRHAHYGWIARHAPGVPGLQPHTAEDARREESGMRDGGHFPIFLPDGRHWRNLTDWQRKNFVPVHWDEGPEVVFAIRKENKRIVRLREGGKHEDLPESRLPEGGQYGRNLACVDVLGDYRENIVTVDTERHSLVVLANPTPMHRRGYSPSDSFEYRHDRSQLGSGYYIYLSPPDTRVDAPRR